MATKKAAKRSAGKAKPPAKAKSTAKSKATARATPRAKAKSMARAKAKPPARNVRKTKVRATPETLRLRTASPGFTVNDLEKSLAWYRDVLGCVVEERWEQDGVLRGASLLAGDVTIMIGQDDWMKGRDRKKGEGFRLYLETAQDVDVLAAGMKARGAALDHEPTDQPWGMRDFALTDPDGFKLTIAAARKPARR